MLYLTKVFLKVIIMLQGMSSSLDWPNDFQITSLH